MAKIHIVGAGLSGLLAGNILRHRAIIFEQQKELPHNHSALLRFRSGVFGTAIGIPFKEVTMIKGVYGDNSNPIKNMIQYSMKVSGQARTDRSIMQGFVQEKRYIAPPDLIVQMSEGLDIRYGTWMIESKIGDCPIISTIPMPKLMDMLEYPYRNDLEFKHRAGVNVTADIKNCEAYATFYYPTSKFGAYRASITGSKLIIEFVEETEGLLEQIDEFDEDGATLTANQYGSHFGIDEEMIENVQVKKQAYAKILPINDEARREFMHWATDKHNIYSLGRYATWRPSLLLDDLVHDVDLISKWVLKGGKYGAARHRAQGSLL